MEVSVLIVVAVIAVFVGIQIYKRRKTVEPIVQVAITLEDLATLVEKIKTTGSDGSYVQIYIPGTELGENGPANLQLSIEAETLGIDWVLFAERNIEDKLRFVQVIRDNGCKAVETSMNGVDYIRVEEVDDFASLSREILECMYDVTEDVQLELFVDGFDWP